MYLVCTYMYKLINNNFFPSHSPRRPTLFTPPIKEAMARHLPCFRFHQPLETMTSLHQAPDAVHYHPVGREDDTYTSLSAFPDSHSQRAFGRGLDGKEADKCCRICLHEDDPDDMLAPCHCKGTAKWVHRECLDLWRTNEKGSGL